MGSRQVVWHRPLEAAFEDTPRTNFKLRSAGWGVAKW